ncbi:MAG: 5-carboxymethyl-2-hydroxymuconate Delta-isomerase [Oceanospirillaceae bacterium]
MPHFTVEYTDNIKDEVDIRAMLVKANQILIAQKGVFPIGGIRSRAIELKDYVMSDDEEDYAFVHASLKVGSGRSQEQIDTACNALFEMMKAHLATQFEQRYIALSMEFSQFSEAGTYKHNNVHARFKK